MCESLVSIIYDTVYLNRSLSLLYFQSFLCVVQFVQEVHYRSVANGSFQQHDPDVTLAQFIEQRDKPRVSSVDKNLLFSHRENEPVATRYLTNYNQAYSQTNPSQKASTRDISLDQSLNKRKQAQRRANGDDYAYGRSFSPYQSTSKATFNENSSVHAAEPRKVAKPTGHEFRRTFDNNALKLGLRR